MPGENVCQRCEAPLRPSEFTWCVPCARGVWQGIWPGVRDVINGALPTERTALANMVAWITGLRPDLSAEILAAVTDIVSEQNRWWRKAPEGGFASPAPLRPQVQAAADVWRAWTACQGELRRLGDTLSPSKQIAVLMWGAVAVRRLVRRYLRRRFNFDIRRQHFVRGSTAPQLAHDWNMMVGTLQSYILCERELRAGLVALWRASHEGKTPAKGMQDAIEAILTTRQQSVPLINGPLLVSSFTHQREYGTLMMAGYAYMKISLYANPSLYKSLTQEDTAVAEEPGSLWTKLQERLLPNVYLAWYEQGWKTPEEFCTIVASLVEDEGADLGLSVHLLPESLQKAHQELSQWGREELSLEEWTAMQEAHQKWHELAHSAGLTPREAEVLALVGEGRTYDDIARCLDVAVGTVGSTKNHAVEKLRKTAQS